MKLHPITILTLLLGAVLTSACVELMMRNVNPRPSWAQVLHTASPEFSGHTITWTEDGPDNYRSPLMNVVDRTRVTVGQPKHYDHTIYMFGASTLFGYYNTDGGTIASQLQRLIPTYRVVNEGLPGAGIVTTVGRLKTIHLKPGDIVIFYDGQMDLRSLAIDINQRQFSLCRYLLENADSIALVHMACDNNAGSSNDASLTAAAVEHYLHWIEVGHRYTAEAGATFYHVLEPVKVTQPQTPHEWFVSTYDPAIATMQNVYDSFYGAVRRAGVIDVSQTLNTMRSQTDVYVDNYHITDKANAVVARAIYGAIWRTF